MSSAAKHVLHEALLWGAVAVTGFALFYFFDDIKAALGPGTDSARPIASRQESGTESQGFAREVRLKADPRGHFIFEAAINDRPASFMADTGATLVVLTYEDAARLGLSPHRLDFTGLEPPEGLMSGLARTGADVFAAAHIAQNPPGATATGFGFTPLAVASLMLTFVTIRVLLVTPKYLPAFGKATSFVFQA